jgi:hypothetical protein
MLWRVPGLLVSVMSSVLRPDHSGPGPFMDIEIANYVLLALTTRAVRIPEFCVAQ